MSIDKCKPRTSGDATRIDDLFDIYKFSKAWTAIRFIDTPHLVVANHWIDITTKEGKATRFPKICLAWDPVEDEPLKGAKCPYCDAGLTKTSSYYFNVIIRSIQEDEPGKKGKLTEEESETGLKSKGSKAWTPVRVVQMSGSLVAKVQALRSLNIRKTKDGPKEFSVTHTKFGMDVNVMFNDKEKAASNKYTVNSGEKTALTEEELSYLTWNLGEEGLIKTLGQETLEHAKLEINRLKASGVIDKEDSDSDSDDEYVMNPSKAKKMKKSSRDDDDSDDDDEDDVPRPSKKSSKKHKESFDEDDEDDDDEPVKKKVKGKRPEPEDDEDDDDDEPVKKKVKSKPSFDDDDDDDEPVKKKPKSKPSFDDDDDD